MVILSAIKHAWHFRQHRVAPRKGIYCPGLLWPKGISSGSSLALHKRGFGCSFEPINGAKHLLDWNSIFSQHCLDGFLELCPVCVCLERRALKVQINGMLSEREWKSGKVAELPRTNQQKFPILSHTSWTLKCNWVCFSPCCPCYCLQQADFMQSLFAQHTKSLNMTDWSWQAWNRNFRNLHHSSQASFVHAVLKPWWIYHLLPNAENSHREIPCGRQFPHTGKRKCYDLVPKNKGAVSDGSAQYSSCVFQ